MDQKTTVLRQAPFDRLRANGLLKLKASPSLIRGRTDAGKMPALHMGCIPIRKGFHHFADVVGDFRLAWSGVSASPESVGYAVQIGVPTMEEAIAAD